MKLAILFSLSLLICGATAATPTPPPATGRTLAVVVVDSLPRIHTGYDDFNLIAEEFGNAFDARHWPVKVTFERFAANNDQHAIELKVFNQGITREFTERRIRAWVILTIDGTKHDFGIVDYRYLPRPGELMDDTIHHIYRAEGDKIAQLIEPYLVPATAKK